MFEYLRFPGTSSTFSEQEQMFMSEITISKSFHLKRKLLRPKKCYLKIKILNQGDWKRVTVYSGYQLRSATASCLVNEVFAQLGTSQTTSWMVHIYSGSGQNSFHPSLTAQNCLNYGLKWIVLFLLTLSSWTHFQRKLYFLAQGCFQHLPEDCRLKKADVIESRLTVFGSSRLQSHSNFFISQVQVLAYKASFSRYHTLSTCHVKRSESLI